jgi:ABC-type dipeptide/oligopeptide/nickel transport system ATPase component
MLLEVSGLAVDVATPRGLQRVVDRTSFFSARANLGVVGESGPGKTMTALALMALTPEGRAPRSDPLRGAKFVGRRR